MSRMLVVGSELVSVRNQSISPTFCWSTPIFLFYIKLMSEIECLEPINREEYLTVLNESGLADLNLINYVKSIQ